MSWANMRDKIISILTMDDGTMINLPRFYKKISEGYGFATSKRFDSLGAGETISFFFQNPSNSGRIGNIIDVEVVGGAELGVDVYKNNTLNSGGTTLDVLNLRPSSTIQNSLIVEYGGNYTKGALIYNMVVPGGSKQFAIGGAVSLGEAIILDPGVNFLLDMINKSASDCSASAKVIWWEDP